ncbi:MAG: type II toxin-antitoxin system HicA family toxin [archaeon]|nr:type II toxin-antitoxin system HicA family toxin [archaeon]
MKLPSLTPRELISKLKKGGFVFDRQAKGSHEIWYNPVTCKRTVVPNHPGKDISKGTLRAIIKEAGLTLEEFLEL